MEELIAYRFPLLLKASGQAAVIVLLVLAVQSGFGRWLSPRWRNGLWWLVILRLALPWTIPAPVSLFNLLNVPQLSASFVWGTVKPNSRVLEASAGAVETTGAAAASTLRASRAWAGMGPRAAWLPRIWAAGALTLTLLALATHRRLSRRIARQRPLADASVAHLLEDCKLQMGMQSRVTLVETPAVGGPSLFGFVRPRLLLPVGLTQSFSPEELRHVFLHELSHIKRRDIQMAWLMTALQIVHWFNPLVWWASHRMRVDRELACDALALSYGREDENQRYGQTIIKLLERFGQSTSLPSLAGAVEKMNQMKERIRMIAKFKKSNRGLALASCLFASLALVTLTDAQTPSSRLAKDLVGTWILVGKPGEVGEPPAAGGRFKTLTDQHWSVTQSSVGSGAVIFHHGGSWRLKGDQYFETVESANENTKNLIGVTSKFNVKLEGDTLTLVGVGNPWNEVWKRVNPDVAKPTPSVTTALQGDWRGQEIGGGAKPASLVFQGSNFEFRSADTNEWYKAAFTVYETNPKQLVAVITDCPVREYVGVTTYAIYQLVDGTLTLTGNEPGNPLSPAGFEAPGARKFSFKQK